MDLQIIGASCDDDKDDWLEAIKKHELEIWPQIRSLEDTKDNSFFKENDVADSYNIESIPSYILIDKQGKIIKRWRGGNEEVLTSAIDSMLHLN